MVKGVRSKRARHRSALFQPLQMLRLEVDYREKRKLNHLKEVKVDHAFQQADSNPVKRLVLLFLTEVLYRSLKENMPDETLFDWLWQALIWYDLNTGKDTDFHLVFLLKLTQFLGFSPKLTEQNSFRYFDLLEGSFKGQEPAHPHYITGESVEIFKKLLRSSFNDLAFLKLSHHERVDQLQYLMEYYRLHIENFGEIKSLEVIRDILH
jgi:DNA repair protein RecO (recombination protein O)